MNVSFEQLVTVITLLFGSGIFSFFAKNYQTKRQQKRDDFVVITDALYKRIDALEEDMETVKKRNKELIEEHRQKGKQITSLEEELEVLIQRNRRITNEKNQLSRERETLIKQIRSLNIRVDKLEKELKKTGEKENS